MALGIGLLLWGLGLGSVIGANYQVAAQPGSGTWTATSVPSGMQTASGGLSMWPGSSEDWPWGTIYGAHFLAEAQHAGYQVPADFQALLRCETNSSSGN